MHPNRRRKKRPNYGLRTVEVVRGANGFGFTISGQQPCILSCIVQHSPADLAGLRAGDFLISVNAISVSKLAHDVVVNLIGKSSGAIKMTIAEHYYSDSSDEEVSVGRMVGTRKHKPRVPRRKKDFCLDEQQQHVEDDLHIREEDEGGPIEYKAFVGYLGTIEMPKQVPANYRLQTVNGCIKKLRQERRKPTAVLMTVLPTCLTLKNAINQLLAIYPTNRVIYISAAADKEPRYFGLVTSAVSENAPNKSELLHQAGYLDVSISNVSNSCHVFATDPKLIEHDAHVSKADNFRLVCTRDLITGYCLEFPRNALYIVSLVQNMYRLQTTPALLPKTLDANNEMQANSPQPSASSNSDSGIGFRDDCANVSDRILLVEFPQEKSVHSPILASSQSIQRPANILSSSFGLNNVRALHDRSVGNVRALQTSFDVAKHHETFCERSVDVAGNMTDIDSFSMHSGRSVDVDADVFKKPMSITKKRARRLWNVMALGGSSSADSLAKCDLDYSRKLSPKVYVDTPRKKNDSSDEFGGSLKDLRLFGRKMRALAQSEPDVRMQRDSRSQGIDGGLVVALRPPFKRLNNSFRRIGSLRGRVRPASVSHIIKCEDNTTINTCGDGPAAWATSFEELLKCPAGLHTFAEFLKKEFSAENIYFWTACERFRKLSTSAERLAEAGKIYDQHIRVGALEAVNVDSKARQCVEQSLHVVQAGMFLPAQKQIFNLMKFDSYTRFLKSDLYKQCLSGNARHYKLDANLMLQAGGGNKPRRSLSNAEDRRRKSLLPWHRKNRSKTKDGDGDEEAASSLRHDVNENVEMRSSKSSLTSLELGLTANSDISKVNDEHIANGRHPLCRFKLNDGNSTMAQLKQDEPIETMVKRLLEKRGIQYSAFAVYKNKETKALNTNESVLKLAGCEVEIEQRVCFKLNLPNKKVIAVKSKTIKIVVDVLRPILEKYSYSLEQVNVSCNNEPVNVNLYVTAYDNARILVQLNEAFEKCRPQEIFRSATLDEITNRVYEDILQEKGGIQLSSKSAESIKSEDWGSEHSTQSHIINRILKRDSERNRRRKGARLTNQSTASTSASTHSSIEDIRNVDELSTQTHCSKKPIIAKLKAGVMLHNTSESEELYEGLNRAQRARLDDQRGTSINISMPDFLKDGRSAMTVAKNSIHSNNIGMTSRSKIELHDYENQNNANVNITRIVPEKEIEKMIHCRSKEVVKSPNSSSGESVDSAKSEPPPLPPKPKVMPIKPSNWKSRSVLVLPARLSNHVKDCTYLEQATSSFV